jgi:hypothetical protein
LLLAMQAQAQGGATGEAKVQRKGTRGPLQGRYGHKGKSATHRHKEGQQEGHKLKYKNPNLTTERSQARCSRPTIRTTTTSKSKGTVLCFLLK